MSAFRDLMIAKAGKQKVFPRYGLVGTGTQWIDTLIKSNQDMVFECEFMFNNFPNEQHSFVFGQNSAPSYEYFASTGPHEYYAFGGINDSIQIPMTMQVGVIYNIIIQNGPRFRDGVQIGSLYVANYSSLHNMYLFTANNRNTSLRPALCTIFKFRASNPSGIIGDFIPVPQGSTFFSSTPAPSNCMRKPLWGCVASVNV